MESCYDQLEAAVNTARYIIECAPQPMTIGVCDTSHYHCYYSAEDLDFGFQQGDQVRPNSMAARVISSGKRCSARVDQIKIQSCKDFGCLSLPMFLQK